MPPFNHLHPAVVHVPLVLLATAPSLFLAGALWPAQRRGLHAAGLALLLVGLLGGLAALATGEAAESLARRTPELKEALERHEAGAQWSVAIFGFLAAVWLGHLGLVRLRGRDFTPGVARSLFTLWLLVCTLGMAALLRTGHEGGRMVHELHTHGGEP